jgi:CrcB protein
VNAFLLVGLGGVAGALARHLVGERIDERLVDTLAVNTAGSFLLGLLVVAPVGAPVRLAVGVGFCGAFTTFSTFAFETVRSAELHDWRRATANAVVTLVAALAAVGLGGLLGQAL